MYIKRATDDEVIQEAPHATTSFISYSGAGTI